jgi:hypothetical protein
MGTSPAAAAASTDALIARVLGDLHARNPQAAANLEFDLAQCETERKVQTFSVTTKRDGLINFTSDLTDAEVLQSLRSQRSSFAQDLARKFNSLSPAQYAWAHKLAVDYNSNQPIAAGDDTSEPKFAALFAAFEAAKAKGAKRLTLRFAGIKVKPSRDGGALWVTSATETEEGRYGLQPKYLGKITPTAMDSRLPDDVKSVLTEAASDPLTMAIRYGKESGECSCCGRELTDPQSIERGIGPICAVKYGW